MSGCMNASPANSTATVRMPSFAASTATRRSPTPAIRPATGDSLSPSAGALMVGICALIHFFVLLAWMSAPSVIASNAENHQFVTFCFGVCGWGLWLFVGLPGALICLRDGLRARTVGDHKSVAAFSGCLALAAANAIPFFVILGQYFARRYGY